MNNDSAFCSVWSGSTLFAKNASIWKLKDVEIVLFIVSLQKFLYFDKQSWPWSDTAFCSSRIWIYTVLKCPTSAFEQINFKFKL